LVYEAGVVPRDCP